MAGHIAAAAVALLAMGAYYYSSPSQPSTGVTWCQRGDPCWPTSDEIEAFARVMRSDEPRKLEYFPGHPFPPGIPLDLPHSDHSQPLFGLGARSNVIEGMYYVRDPDEGKKCYSFAGDYFSATCNASARNSPFERWHPAFITFPVNEEQIQASLEFAVKHNLCIMVAGTGHEYNNRHSCPTDGMLIRTTQLRSKEYLPKWEINPAFAPHGALRVGPGSTFLEIHEFAQNNRFLIASGWCMSVGIMGWSLGGGHSYMGPHAGLGSQNLLEVTIFQVDISPKGQPIVVRRVVNEQSNADLFFALRGGGGSTWGVISSLTVRVHALPSDGSDEHGYITMVNISRQGHFCDKATFGKYDKDYLHGIIDKHERWTLKLTQKFSQSWIYNTINTSDKGSPSFIIPGAFPKCKQQWTVSAFWFFVGPKNDPEHLARFKEALEALDWTEGDVPGNKLIMFEGYKGLFDYSKSLFDGQMFGYPASYSGPASAENVQSQQTVLVPRNVVESGVWKANFKKLLELCWNAPVGKENCPFHYIYSLKSHIGSPVINGTALSKGMTEGLIHHDTTAIGYFGSSFSQKQMEQFYYNLGDYSYFSESAYYLPGWQKRYWGDNYDALLSIKNKYDPLRKFWCHHCVGDWMFPDS